jgi:hypothetical protein
MYLIFCSTLIIIFFNLNTPVFDTEKSNSMLISPPFKSGDFLWAGKSLSDPSLLDSNGKIVAPAQRYTDALVIFPNLRSCLIESEKIKPAHESLDVSLIDWSAIKSSDEFDICIFHIGSAISNTDKFINWFEISGFKTRSVMPPSEAGSHLIMATWNSEKNGAMTPFPRPLLQQWLENIVAGKRPFSTTIMLNNDHEITSIQSGISFE